MFVTNEDFVEELSVSQLLLAEFVGLEIDGVDCSKLASTVVDNDCDVTDESDDDECGG